MNFLQSTYWRMRTKTVSALFSCILVLLFFVMSCKSHDDDFTVPALTTKDVTEITKTTAKCGGSITSEGGTMISQRGVCWSTNPEPTTDDNKTLDGTGAGTFSSELSELTQGTTYYVRAYAKNSTGTGYGPVKMFQTTGGASLQTFTDNRDGSVYKYVQIGEQVWMAENLRFLPDVIGPTASSISIPYYYVYGYNSTIVSVAKGMSNYAVYGVLYNWTAAMNGQASSFATPSGVQGVCPSGWHIPSYSEWTELSDYLGGELLAGGKLKETGTTHWLEPNTGATDETQFTALPAGNKGVYGQFYNIGKIGLWWSASESNFNAAWSWFTSSENAEFKGYNTGKELGMSVRCIRDN